MGYNNKKIMNGVTLFGVILLIGLYAYGPPPPLNAAPKNITITLSDYDYDKIVVELPGHVWGEPKHIVNNTITVNVSDFDTVVLISYLKFNEDRYVSIAMELIEIDP